MALFSESLRFEAIEECEEAVAGVVELARLPVHVPRSASLFRVFGPEPISGGAAFCVASRNRCATGQRMQRTSQ
jgi:hypothetical protein